jgi:hypothetical protein
VWLTLGPGSPVWQAVNTTARNTLKNSLRSLAWPCLPLGISLLEKPIRITAILS